MSKRRVLILCTGNSVRSQMAEGLLRHLGGDTLEVHSAGTAPVGVSPLAIEAMREISIDITAHRSKSVSEFESQRIHWSIIDPGGATGSHTDKLAAFRRTRDDLASRLRSFLSSHTAAKNS